MRDFWDAHYADDAYIFGTEPNAFLASKRDLLKSGTRALAVADGEGRNGVWLAQQGLDVLSIDISPIGLEKARKLASERKVTVRFQESDVRGWDWGREQFDVIAAIFIQFAAPEDRAGIFEGMKRALKSEGLIILQGYTPKQIQFKTGGPPNPENLYTPELLRECFSDLDILHLHEHEDFIAEGTKHYGMSALIDMVARKP
jgi:SAM-dependent methyltransferase